MVIRFVISFFFLIHGIALFAHDNGGIVSCVLVGESNRVSTLSQDMLCKDSSSERSLVCFIIKHDFDLKGEKIVLPPKCILDFQGGSIRNGILVGDQTQVRAERQMIFENVRISGSWMVEIIYSSWFENARNSIREPFRMLNNNIQNKLIIEEGTWEIEMPDDEKCAINIPSNTEIELIGTIRNYTNQPGGFSIFCISGSENVKICGNGEIIGNRDDKAVAKRGSQTGHSITIGASKNVIIEGITLSYSRGDGVLVGEMNNFNLPENVILRNLRILHSRRQGISICSGHNIKIENIYIDDVSGAPQGPCAGIDVENYDRGGVISNVSISNVMVTNVSIGLSIYNDSDVTYDDKSQSLSGRADLSRIYVSNYIATGCEIGLRIGYLTENIQIENSTFDATDVALSLYSDYSQGHDYSHQFCQQINNCKFLSKKTDLKASVDIRTKGFVFNNCTFETFSPFTVHASATNTIFRDCKFSSPNIVRFLGTATLSGCSVDAKSLSLSKGGKVMNCTIKGLVILHGDNTIRDCDIFCQGKFSNLLTINGENNVVDGNRLNCYNNELDVETKTNMTNVIYHNGTNSTIRNNIIGLKNCKVAIRASVPEADSYSNSNIFCRSVPITYVDKNGLSRIIDYKNGIPFSE